MAARLSIFAIFTAGAVAGLLAPTMADQAFACYVHPTNIEGAARIADVIVVGEVVDEHPIGQPDDAYESTIRVSASLLGEPETEVTLSPLGVRTGDCDGGPRLEAGERVLLFLAYHGIKTEGKFDLQLVAYEDGKYLLEDGVARPADRNPMRAGDALRLVASIVGSSPDQLDVALAFAGVEPPQAPEPAIEPLPTTDQEDSGPSALLIGLAVAGGVAAPAAALLGLRWLRRVR